jgi:hypothetical protein
MVMTASIIVEAIYCPSESKQYNGSKQYSAKGVIDPHECWIPGYAAGNDNN